MLNLRSWLARALGTNDTNENSTSALWDAAGGGNRLANWNPGSIDLAVPPAVLRNRARDLVRNNPWIRCATEVLAVNVVRAGITPQIKLPDPEQKKHLQATWLRWTDQADVLGLRDFYGLQLDLVRTAITDGTVIVRFVLNPAQEIPLQLQILSIEQLDGSRTGPDTTGGIEYDGIGRPVAYWLYPRNPSLAPRMNSIRVPADQICFLYLPSRPGQEQGVSWLAPAMVPARELQEFMEGALTKAKVNALFAGFVTTPDGSNPLQPADASVPTLEPGSMARLRPGETVEFTPSSDVGSNFEPFVRTQLRAIASALGIPYELLSGDVSQVTFASGRHSLLEFKRQLESIQHHFVVFQFCRRVWDLWIRFAIIAGVLPGTPEDYRDVRWIAPLPEMLDPKGDIAALVSKVRAGFMSRSEAVMLSGLDAETVDAEIAADNARADSLGNIYDSDPRKTTFQGQEQPSQAGDLAA